MAFAKLGNNEKVWELLSMINPINHGKTAEAIATYKVEPYVLAADVYANTQHNGRGGWTWYTGSAGWLYRLIIESFLGFQKNGDKLSFSPCIPKDWESFKIHYRYQDTFYRIEVLQKSDVEEMTVTIDGNLQADAIITLVNDFIEHFVEIEIN